MGSPSLDALHGLLAALLFLGAVMGHTSLVVLSHNRWYGAALPRRLTDVIQFLHGLLVLAGPAVFWYAYGFNLTNAFLPPPRAPARLIGAGYVLTCCLVGLVGLPVLTFRRRRHGRPPALVHNHTHTVDLSARLGYRPIGDGKLRFLARLPGNEIFQVDFAERLLRLPRLPAAWEGLTILHLSDLHLGGTPDRRFFQEVMDLCAAWEPDLVALTGDIVDSDRHRRWVVPVLSRLRWRIAAFAILGNHDLWFGPALIRRRVRRSGLCMLGNSWKQIEVRGEPLVVIGHEGPWVKPAPDLSSCPAGPFRLCLSHTPDNIGWARRHSIDLMLAGHNHGGQVRFPVIGSVLVPSVYGRRYDCGVFEEPPTLLHVSRGLGGEQPLRYNCRPEVVKLVLQKG
ncbi:MAG TPA: metallophosphoesterase [Gemmataceae bacterium]|nr:metallophosphoesterase [Gemmataceae bacterium]